MNVSKIGKSIIQMEASDAGLKCFLDRMEGYSRKMYCRIEVNNDAILINTSRGHVIDEAALAQHCK